MFKNPPRIFIPILLFLVGIALLGGGIFLNRGSILSPNLETPDFEASSPNTTNIAAPEVGANAPLFSIENVAGEMVGLEQYQGQVVLLNFWATWCAPCQLEMPYILEAYESADPGEFTVLAINDRESKQTVMGYANQFKLTFPLLLDKDGEVQRQYLVPGLPTSFFIDRDGVIRAMHIGILTEDQLRVNLEKAGLDL